MPNCSLKAIYNALPVSAGSAPTFDVADELTLNLTVVPGCCAAENPDPPNREGVPPNGLEVVLVDPNSPPLLVLVPKSEDTK